MDKYNRPALRIKRVGGRYHATARGNERRDIFLDDTDRFHFLNLPSDIAGRYGIRLHAYALMDNHSLIQHALWRLGPGYGAMVWPTAGSAAAGDAR